MAAPSNLIGSRISLISNKDIRYEGTLFAINQAESSVTLQNVKCYGTEGRAGAGQEWQPDDRVYEYVMFNASDIKDLHVHDAPTAGEAAPKQAPKPAAPAAAQAQQQRSAPPAHHHQQQQQHQGGGGGRGRGGGGGGGRGRGGGRGGGGGGGGGGGRGGAMPGTGDHLLGRRGRTGGPGAGDVKGPEKPEGEFDFMSALQGFNKEAEFAKLSLNTPSSGGAGAGGGDNSSGGGGNAADDAPAAAAASEPVVIPEVKKYNKSSFFDDLSSGPGGARPSYAEERKTNTETFGVSALHNPHARRWGGGGRGGGGYRGGGGGRGRGRGRGRGGGGGRFSEGPRPPPKVSA